MERFNTSSRVISSLTLLVVFLAAPLAGVVLRGDPLSPYLTFPPITTESEQESFSWVAFWGVILFVFAATWPFWKRMAGNSWRLIPDPVGRSQPFPRWGWAAAAGLALFWLLAWTRFSWFESFQRYTFFPIWFCFIILLNAAAVRVSGKSLLTHRTLYFTILFPVSAFFWWGFEYLNRFASNWHYTGTGSLEGWQYFAEASVAFSTVLPAVMSMRYLLLQTEMFAKGYRNFPVMPWLTSESLWALAGVASAIALVVIGWIPNLTYPLIWIMPGLLWVAWQRWNGYVNPLLEKASRGDLTLIWASACAALLCGFFWEMWNMYSLARWTYSTPALNGLRLFEMPLPGYAGYLPFGVICALVANSVLTTLTHKDRVVAEEMVPEEKVQP